MTSLRAAPATPVIPRSEALFADAQALLPGGVNSPVRAFRGVGGTPRFIARGNGAYMEDVDGHVYLDLVLSWGPLSRGHAAPRVVQAITDAAQRGTSYGAPCELEVELARRVIATFPALEMVRFVNSGTEATMSALRLARAATGRSLIVKFDGCYHGHADALLAAAGSGVATLGLPDSPGVSPAVVADTLVIGYNDVAAVEQLFAARGNQIAAVIVEPVAGNMGVVPPVPGFLEALREECTRHGAVLIFDEVMTGFRVARGGAQELYGIRPDLTTLGKIVGGGMPVGAFGGRREIMQHIAPLGPVYQAGTLSGNPVAMAAGLATLAGLEAPGFHSKLARATERLVHGLAAAAQQAGVPLATNHVCGMFGLFFTNAGRVTSYQEATHCDVERFKRFFHGMLAEGVYLAPSAFEAGFVSAAHTDVEIDATIEAARRVFARI